MTFKPPSVNLDAIYEEIWDTLVATDPDHEVDLSQVDDLFVLRAPFNVMKMKREVTHTIRDRVDRKRTRQDAPVQLGLFTDDVTLYLVIGDGRRVQKEWAVDRHFVKSIDLKEDHFDAVRAKLDHDRQEYLTLHPYLRTGLTYNQAKAAYRAKQPPLTPHPRFPQTPPNWTGT